MASITKFQFSRDIQHQYYPLIHYLILGRISCAGTHDYSVILSKLSIRL